MMSDDRLGLYRRMLSLFGKVRMGLADIELNRKRCGY